MEHKKNCMKVKFQCPCIKFYWDTAIPILPRIVYSCLPDTKTELNSCKRDCMTPQSLNKKQRLYDPLLKFADPYPTEWNMAALSFCYSFHYSRSGYLLSIYQVSSVLPGSGDKT